MVLGSNFAIQIAALLAIAASGNGLLVPNTNKKDISSRDLIADVHNLRATTEGLPQGVVRQPLAKIAHNDTSEFTRRINRFTKRDGGPFQTKGNDTLTDQIFALTSSFFAYLELFDGNGGSLGSSLVAVDTGSSDLWTNSPIIATQFSEFIYGYFDPDADTTNSTKLLSNHTTTIQYEDTTESVFRWWTGTVGAYNSSYPLKDFQFGVAISNNASSGIFGIGPASNEVTSTKYANYPVALKQQGLINKVAFSIYLGNGLLEPPTPAAEVLWGGIDNGLYTGDLVSFPNLYPYWPTIDLQTITSSNGTVYQINAPVIFDTGTTTGVLSDAIVDQINDAFGYVNGKATKYPTEGSLTIDFGSLKLDVSYTNFWANVSGTLLVYNFLPASEYGNITVFGDTILKDAYVVYDYEANTTSVAQANHNVTFSDVVAIV